MNAKKNPDVWSKESFALKAEKYLNKMKGEGHDSWEFGVWSTFVLEMLARAALSSISPVLLADTNNKTWYNIYYVSVGHEPPTPRFQSKMIGITEVINRLDIIEKVKIGEIKGFCMIHFNRRNAELHSDDNSFEGLGTSDWLPSFYRACEVLLEMVGSDLNKFLGDEATTAKELINSEKDEASKAVLGSVESFSRAWNDKREEERTDLQLKAKGVVSRHFGHCVKCPACKSEALVKGDYVGVPTPKIEDDYVVERQSMMPTSFECFACGLKIGGLAKLLACGLGDSYTATHSYPAAEYFEFTPEDFFEPDFNE